MLSFGCDLVSLNASCCVSDPRMHACDIHEERLPRSVSVKAFSCQMELPPSPTETLLFGPPSPESEDHADHAMAEDLQLHRPLQ